MSFSTILFLAHCFLENGVAFKPQINSGIDLPSRSTHAAEDVPASLPGEPLKSTCCCTFKVGELVCPAFARSRSTWDPCCGLQIFPIYGVCTAVRHILDITWFQNACRTIYTASTSLLLASALNVLSLLTLSHWVI